MILEAGVAKISIGQTEDGGLDADDDDVPMNTAAMVAMLGWFEFYIRVVSRVGEMNAIREMNFFTAFFNVDGNDIFCFYTFQQLHFELCLWIRWVGG